LLLKPRAFGGKDSHFAFRYSFLDSHSCFVQPRLRSTFILQHDAPLPLIQKDESVSSVPGLAPLNFPRGITRSVSYYALFKGWLLLSQPPDCLSNSTSLTT
jgi:hypothetical protein